MVTISLAVVILLGIGVSLALLKRKKTTAVPEDHVAVTVTKHGFIKRVLGSGRHLLYPGERIEFVLETRTKLVRGQATRIATGDGLLLTINWSGTYALCPEQITDNRSQRLRGLLRAEKAITRNVDIFLRKLVGGHTVSDLFNPGLRERLERQLNHLLADKLKPLGITFNGLNLQAIDLPPELTEAMTKARAIETLDGAVRHLDPATRDIIRGVYQLDQVLHWDAYLPVPSRHTMKKLAATHRN
jgi:regulator of protease activity HflC (stomatin/prohibitin superfamily)